MEQQASQRDSATPLPTLSHLAPKNQEDVYSSKPWLLKLHHQNEEGGGGGEGQEAQAKT